MITRIEIDFALPVEITGEQYQALSKFVGRICDQNCPEGWAFWPAGYGNKPNFSKTDSVFLGKEVDPNAPESGGPTWDDSVFHINCAARELYPNEIEKRKAKAMRVAASQARWWVRLLSTVADGLHKRGLKGCSWIVADFCIWLQRRSRRSV